MKMCLNVDSVLYVVFSVLKLYNANLPLIYSYICVILFYTLGPYMFNKRAVPLSLVAKSVFAGLGGVRLVIRRLRVPFPPGPATFFRGDWS